MSTLGRKLRFRGIPVWQDISDLGSGSTEAQIRAALTNPTMASAVVWITPEVLGSAVIRGVEVPLMVKRVNNRDGFFAIMAAAGGLDYDQAAVAAAENLGLDDLHFWNLHRVTGDPAPPGEIGKVARLVLRHRLDAVHAAALAGATLELGLYVRHAAPLEPGASMQLDWYEAFDGRHAAEEVWESELLSALRDVYLETAARAPGHPILAHGQPTLAAAVALGHTFSATAGIPLAWQQLGPGGPEGVWSLAVRRESSGYTATFVDHDPAADGLAVIVSVAQSGRLAFGRAGAVPKMRAVVEIFHPDPAPPRLSAGQASDVAYLVIEAVKEARRRYVGLSETHLFLACPAGLAVLIGQFLNALGPVVVYEHDDSDAIGRYSREVRLLPAGSRSH